MTDDERWKSLVPADARAEFDAWLAEERAEAWDDGYLAHRQEMNRATILGLKTSIPNPHRKETDE